MNKKQAIDSSKTINKEIFTLNPSALVTLFEIDFSNILQDLDLNVGQDIDTNLYSNPFFRFHNNVKLTHNNIFWLGDEYVVTPIMAEGFEISSKGTLPTPILSLAVPDVAVPLFANLRDTIKRFGDLIGAKVTRIRTFAKFLDDVNFSMNERPEGFDPAVKGRFEPELPRDVFYIDRKSNETKNVIEFELASILDVEGVKLPGRLVIANKCLFSYRGMGCLYEYGGANIGATDGTERRVPAVHGKIGESILPNKAPPIANDRDEKLGVILSGDSQNPMAMVDLGLYVLTKTDYSKGDFVYIQKNGIKYYFVAKIDNPPKGPPNLLYWLSDQCSKTIPGCKLRWDSIGDGSLPTSSYPAVNKLQA